ncbi:TetR/AcrR family transcriptional regulator [Sciscionella marina]|uniref:TetR/AcrR family transcriptional regulator n=1 Tax=Sciscionella marina TaxID=508770 RepID=UPI0003821EB6|nr:TetR/AcrR family transcriptional regulator [Sciscionella marina]
MTAPQQERSKATRLRLVEAAVDCLAEKGWSGTTVAIVARAAGVSRGAAQHHFPTREDLIAGALEFATETQLIENRARAAALPEHGLTRVEAVVNMLVDIYVGPYFRAALQVWVAASADPSLHARVQPLEARLGRTIHHVAVELLRADERKPGVRETIQGTLDMARGFGLATVLGDDSARRRPIVRQWARVLAGVLGEQ